MLERFRVPEADQVLVDQAAVRAASVAIFRKMGVSENDAQLAADVLVTSDLRGCESHGVSNMFRRYLESYAAAELNPMPEVKVLRESPVSAAWDADGGLGLHVMCRKSEAI